MPMKETAPSSGLARRATTTVRGAERYRALIEAAVQRIAEVGIEGFRVRDVADHVGVNIATLHHYFPTKENLLIAVVVELTGRLRGILSGTGQSRSSGKANARFRRHVDQIFAEIVREPQTFAVMIDLMVRANRDREISTVIAASQQPWRAFLIDLMASEVEAGRFAAANADRIADQFISLILGECLQLSIAGQLKPTPDRNGLRASRANLIDFLDRTFPA